MVLQADSVQVEAAEEESLQNPLCIQANLRHGKC